MTRRGIPALIAAVAMLLPGLSREAGAPLRAQAHQSGGQRTASNLVGSARASDGRAMEGVAVSARATGKSITTSVFTDERGEYVFPPLDSGRYEVWAQAVGYETTR